MAEVGVEGEEVDEPAEGVEIGGRFVGRGEHVGEGGAQRLSADRVGLRVPLFKERFAISDFRPGLDGGEQARGPLPVPPLAPGGVGGHEVEAQVLKAHLHRRSDRPKNPPARGAGEEVLPGRRRRPLQLSQALGDQPPADQDAHALLERPHLQVALRRSQSPGPPGRPQEGHLEGWVEDLLPQERQGSGVVRIVRQVRDEHRFPEPVVDLHLEPVPLVLGERLAGFGPPDHPLHDRDPPGDLLRVRLGQRDDEGLGGGRAGQEGRGDPRQKPSEEDGAAVGKGHGERKRATTVPGSSETALPGESTIPTPPDRRRVRDPGPGPSKILDDRPRSSCRRRPPLLPCLSPWSPSTLPSKNPSSSCGAGSPSSAPTLKTPSRRRSWSACARRSRSPPPTCSAASPAGRRPWSRATPSARTPSTTCAS